MASEILSVPEEYLPEVIMVIRAGMKELSHILPDEVKEALTKWCDEEDEYLDT